MRMRWIGALFVVLAVACGRAEKGSFSKLIEPKGEHFDLTVSGIDAIRETSLPPGARPGKAKIEGDRATRTLHFLATYSREVTPEEVGKATVIAFREAGFAEAGDVKEEPGEGTWSATIPYTAEGSTGTLRLKLSATDRRNVLELLYGIAEELR